MLKRLKRPLTIFIFGSLLLHGLGWLSLQLSKSSPHIASPRDLVQVEYREIQEPELNAVQIAEQKDQLNKEKDEAAKYLSAFDQKVEKQTQAKNQGKFQNTTAKGAMAPKESSTALPEPESDPTEEPLVHNKKGLPSLSSLTPQFRPRPVQPTITGDEGQENQVSQTDDYLKDVETDMQTMLSTREFVYYTYYARIKERIRQHWEPTVRGKVKMIYRQGRTIASTKDHITQVVITLNKKGELLGVEVVTPSGLVQLDDAAVEAFRAAQPFPNPPRGLVDDEGFIRIRWDFVLEANNDMLPSIRHHSEYARGVEP